MTSLRIARAEHEHRAGRHEAPTSLTHGHASDDCWTDERDRRLIEAADALHDGADIGDTLWDQLRQHFTKSNSSIY